MLRDKNATVCVDITREAALVALVQDTINQFGLAVNSAGIVSEANITRSLTKP